MFFYDFDTTLQMQLNNDVAVYERRIDAMDVAQPEELPDNLDKILYAQKNEFVKKLLHLGIDQLKTLREAHEQGYKALEQGQYKEAINAYDKALKIEPNNALHLFGRGLVAEELKQWQDALADYNRVLQANPPKDTADDIRQRIKRVESKLRN